MKFGTFLLILLVICFVSVEQGPQYRENPRICHVSKQKSPKSAKVGKERALIKRIRAIVDEVDPYHNDL